MKNKKRSRPKPIKKLFGIKPTGKLHLGHYYTIKDHIHDSYFLIADEHAKVSYIGNSFNIKKGVEELILSLISLGVPKEHIYVQSDLQFNNELSFYLSCFSNTTFLNRMHLVKQKNDFTISEYFYPVLMTADIIISKCQYVVIGKDQLQHIEFANDIIKKIRHLITNFHFKIKTIVQEILIGCDGRKMSKSYNNCISIFDDETTIERQINQIITSPSMSLESNLFKLQSVVLNNEEKTVLKERYLHSNYKDEKLSFFKSLKQFITLPKQNYLLLSKKYIFIRKTIKSNSLFFKRNLKKYLKQFKSYFKAN